MGVDSYRVAQNEKRFVSKRKNCFSPRAAVPVGFLFSLLVLVAFGSDEAAPEAVGRVGVIEET